MKCSLCIPVIAFVSGLSLVCSCAREPGILSAPLALSVALQDGPESRTLRYDAAQPFETAVNSVQFLVFDHSSGLLEHYGNSSTAAGASGFSLPLGRTYVAWAFVNAPDLSGCSSLDDLSSLLFSLSDNHASVGTGFVLAGGTSPFLHSEGAPARTVVVKRIASRVALVKVNNNLPNGESILIKRIWLSNVVSRMTGGMVMSYYEGGTVPSSSSLYSSFWINKEGRTEISPRTSASVIDGESRPASCPDLTFRQMSRSIQAGSSYEPSSPVSLYCFQNVGTPNPSGFHSSFSAQKTVLVLDAEIAGHPFYYPVVLPAVRMNTSYSVEVTVTGPGTSDPNVVLDKASLVVNVTEAGWTLASAYAETI